MCGACLCKTQHHYTTVLWGVARVLLRSSKARVYFIFSIPLYLVHSWVCKPFKIHMMVLTVWSNKERRWRSNCSSSILIKETKHSGVQDKCWRNGKPHKNATTTDKTQLKLRAIYTGLNEEPIQTQVNISSTEGSQISNYDRWNKKQRELKIL